jgi:hypothetical protein
MENPEVLMLARSMLANSKGWGCVPERAILTGQWDEGQLIREYIKKAEISIMKHRKEMESE